MLRYVLCCHAGSEGHGGRSFAVCDGRRGLGAVQVDSVVLEDGVVG